jgi:hypothetical protein
MLPPRRAVRARRLRENLRLAWYDPQRSPATNPYDNDICESAMKSLKRGGICAGQNANISNNCADFTYGGSFRRGARDLRAKIH